MRSSWIVLVLVGVACASDVKTDPALRTVRLTGTFVDARSEQPLAKLEVCAAERDDVACGHTDEDGHIDMQLPADSEVMLSCIIHSHVAMYMTLTTTSADLDFGTFRIIDKILGTLFVAAGRGGVPPGSGMVLVNVYEDSIQRDTRVAEMTSTISAGDADGPVYGVDNGLPSRTLEKSSAGGPIVFYAVPEGETAIDIAHPSRTCVPAFGWLTGSSTRLRTKVFAGGISTVTFVCPPG